MQTESPTSKGRVNWRCFHCDETFRSRDAAREHFGPTECSKPACAIDVTEYRRMEAEIARWRSEDTDLHRALYAEQAKLTPAVRRAEEQGYERGLADGRKLPDETPGMQPCAATISTDPPQDCNAPFCGCNPEWHKVIEWLTEAGWAPPIETSACNWTYDIDGFWNTGCGHAFAFSDGTPKDNGAKFCQYCGGALVEVKQPPTTGEKE